MSGPSLLLDSFDEALPKFTVYNNAPQVSLSTHTKAEIPPVFAIEQEVSPWIEKAETFLEQLHPEAKAALGKEKMAEIDSSTCHYNESNVVTSLDMYLLHAIHRVMTKKYDKYLRISEYSMESMRGDETFFKGPFDNRIAIALFEVKRRKVIRANEFSEAADPASGGIRKTIEKIEAEARKNRTTENVVTKFRGKALKLVKQVTTYAVLNQVEYVALCDYDHLVLFRFPELKGEKEQEARKEKKECRAGPYCHYTLLEVEGNVKVRKAMLGFIVEAWEKKSE